MLLRAGDWDRSVGSSSAARPGGVPNLGGEVPIELDNAAARADMPGPDELAPAPASGAGLADRPLGVSVFPLFLPADICDNAGDVPRAGA